MKMISILAEKTTQSGGDRQDMSTRLRRNALLLPLCVVGCYWAILIYYLGAQWSAYEQYNYGWAVPFLCVYLVWRKTESRKQKAEMGAPGQLDHEITGPGEQGAKGRGQRAESHLPSSIFYLLLAFLALLY